MGQLNIRNVPEDLMKRAKIAAIQNGMTLKDFVLRAVEVATKRGSAGKARQ